MHWHATLFGYQWMNASDRSKQTNWNRLKDDEAENSKHGKEKIMQHLSGQCKKNGFASDREQTQNIWFSILMLYWDDSGHNTAFNSSVTKQSIQLLIQTNRLILIWGLFTISLFDFHCPCDLQHTPPSTFLMSTSSLSLVPFCLRTTSAKAQLWRNLSEIGFYEMFLWSDWTKRVVTQQPREGFALANLRRGRGSGECSLRQICFFFWRLGIQF